MKIIKTTLILLTVCTILLSCAGSMQSQKNIESIDDPLEAIITELGFIPFKVFYEEPYLGYIMDLQNKENPLKMVWEGELETANVNQSVEVQYSYEQIPGLSIRIPFVASIEGKFSTSESVEVQLIGLEKYVLTEPELKNEFYNITEYHSRPYIDSMLRAEKVVVKIVNSSGVSIGASATITGLFGVKVGAEYSYDEQLEGIIAAENAIIGYTLRTPEFADLIPVTQEGLIFSVLGWKQGVSTEWQPLNRKGYLRTGDYYKLVFRANREYYVYIFNIDSREMIYPLFPRPDIEYENPVIKDAILSIPEGKNHGFILDKNTGSEIIEFYVCEEENIRLKELSAYLYNNFGEITVDDAREQLDAIIQDFNLTTVEDYEFAKILDYTQNMNSNTYSIYNANKIFNIGEGIYYSFNFNHIEE